MQIVIHQWAFDGSFEQLEMLPTQEFTSDWYGYDIEPPAQFSFATDGKYLWFLARRDAPAMVHPDAKPGKFQAELWKYDVAEWFMASNTTGHYWEFNLSPNGAWWSSLFDDVRHAAQPAPSLSNVETKAALADDSWVSMAKIPLSELGGIDIRDCKLASAFILNSPDQIFMTTALDLSGEPDYHRPGDYSAPILK